MSTTLLIARLLLAGFFAVAGTAKFADSQGSQQAIIDFGLPSSLAAPALLFALIHRSAWNRNSPKFIYEELDNSV